VCLLDPSYTLACPTCALQQGLAPLTSVVRGDFTKMPFEANSFDGAYAIEATCHAPKVCVFAACLL